MSDEPKEFFSTSAVESLFNLLDEDSLLEENSLVQRRDHLLAENARSPIPLDTNQLQQQENSEMNNNSSRSSDEEENHRTMRNETIEISDDVSHRTENTTKTATSSTETHQHSVNENVHSEENTMSTVESTRDKQHLLNSKREIANNEIIERKSNQRFKRNVKAVAEKRIKDFFSKSKKASANQVFNKKSNRNFTNKLKPELKELTPSKTQPVSLIKPLNSKILHDRQRKTSPRSRNSSAVRYVFVSLNDNNHSVKESDRTVTGPAEITNNVLQSYRLRDRFRGIPDNSSKSPSSIKDGHPNLERTLKNNKIRDNSKSSERPSCSTVNVNDNPQSRSVISEGNDSVAKGKRRNLKSNQSIPSKKFAKNCSLTNQVEADASQSLISEQDRPALQNEIQTNVNDNPQSRSVISEGNDSVAKGKRRNLKSNQSIPSKKFAKNCSLTNQVEADASQSLISEQDRPALQNEIQTSSVTSRNAVSNISNAKNKSRIGFANVPNTVRNSYNPPAGPSFLVSDRHPARVKHNPIRESYNAEGPEMIKTNNSRGPIAHIENPQGSRKTTTSDLAFLKSYHAYIDSQANATINVSRRDPNLVENHPEVARRNDTRMPEANYQWRGRKKRLTAGSSQVLPDGLFSNPQPCSSRGNALEEEAIRDTTASSSDDEAYNHNSFSGASVKRLRRPYNIKPMPYRDHLLRQSDFFRTRTGNRRDSMNMLNNRVQYNYPTHEQVYAIRNHQPSWFDKFLRRYERLNDHRFHSVRRTYERLMDMEGRKIDLMEQIVSSLQNDD